MSSDPGRPARPPRQMWREEISIDAEVERYVSRRQFGKFLVLTSLGMFAGNVWILLRSRMQRAAARPAPARIAEPGELAPGQLKLFDYPTRSDPCLLVRARDGRLRAFSQKCTHLSCAVIYSPDMDRLECPCHDGVFSVATGAVEQGPPPRPLPRIELEERPDGIYAVGIVSGEADGGG